MFPFPLETYLWSICVIAVLANLFNGAMFIARTRKTGHPKLWRNLALIMGLPALMTAVVGLLSGYSSAYDFGALYWISPLVYALFCVATFAFSVIPGDKDSRMHRSGVVVPLFILLFGGLLMMWGTLWELGSLAWALSGVTFAIMLFSSLAALRVEAD